MILLRKFSIVCILLVSAYEGGTFAAQEEPPVLTQMQKPPVVDGRIEEGEWSQAHSLGTLKVRDGATMPETKAWIAMDHSALYIAVHCDEPTPEKIKIATLAYEENQPVWDDDSVEVYLDMGNTGQSLFRLVSNAAGTTFSARIVNLQQMDAPWASGATVKTHVGPSFWEAEIAIPFSSLRHELKRGEVFAINVGRTRHAGERQPQIASLLRGGHFIFPEHNITLLAEGPIEADGLSLISTKRGPFFKQEAGVWEFEIAPQAGTGGRLLATFQGKEFPVTMGDKKQTVSIPIPSGEAESWKQAVLTYQGRDIYSSGYEVENIALPERVAITSKPLFDELLEPLPDGLAKDGVMIWAHELQGVSRPEHLAIRTGTEFSIQGAMREYARDRAILVTSGSYMQPNWADLFNQYHVKTIVDLRAGEVKGVPLFGKHQWALDPRVEQAYLEKARDAIEAAKTNPYIWGLSAGDELWERNEELLRRLIKDKGRHYAQFHAANREVRAKYGFGKYAFPESVDDSNPYRWIATRRWEIDKMISIQQKIRKMVEEECPRLKMLSWDNYPGHYPRGIGKWGKVFDVITGQLYPFRNKDLEEFGFTTKWLHDLSGAPEVWPCPHVEHYGGSFSPEEVEELLSQIFRNGATGLHLYAADTIKRRRGAGSFNTERIGAPERWDVVRSVIDRMQKPFKVKQPTPDVGIFYSNTSYQGQSTLRKTGEVEWLYTILGPRLQGAFKFIDELLCQEAPDQLAQYKVIYVPYAPIADDAEYTALERYVENGGTLVVCDPFAFRNRSDGTERSSGVILPPLESTKTSGVMPLISADGGASRQLPAMSEAYPLKNSGTLLAAYPDSRPGIIEVSAGKGKVIYFGENPLASSVIASQPWIQFFSTLQEREQVSMGHAVWRFRFPGTRHHPAVRPEGVCLTGNYFEWRLSEPEALANGAVGGSYQISHPDLAAGEPANQDVSFAQGRLTDRVRGAAAKNDVDADAHSLTWNLGEPLLITYRFHRPVEVRLLRMYFSGTLPGGWCEISGDGKQWEKSGEWKARSSASGILPWSAQDAAEQHSVALEAIALPGEKAAYLRVHFEPTEKARFTLAETDLWGNE